MRARVALPPGCGAARDVRLSGGGASTLAPGPATALVASLGNRLSVVDLERDHVAASIALRAPAWSCAWGGWCVGAPRILSDGVAEARTRRTTLVRSVDTRASRHRRRGDGTVALYDLRRAAAPLAEIRRGAHTGTRRVSRRARLGRGALRGRRRGASRERRGTEKYSTRRERYRPRVTGRRRAPSRSRRVGARSNPREKRATRSRFRAAATGA